MEVKKRLEETREKDPPSRRLNMKKNIVKIKLGLCNVNYVKCLCHLCIFLRISPNFFPCFIPNASKSSPEIKASGTIYSSEKTSVSFDFSYQTITYGSSRFKLLFVTWCRNLNLLNYGIENVCITFNYCYQMYYL